MVGSGGVTTLTVHGVSFYSAFRCGSCCEDLGLLALVPRERGVSSLQLLDCPPGFFEVAVTPDAIAIAIATAANGEPVTDARIREEARGAGRVGRAGNDRCCSCGDPSSSPVARRTPDTHVG